MLRGILGRIPLPRAVAACVVTAALAIHGNAAYRHAYDRKTDPPGNLLILEAVTRGREHEWQPGPGPGGRARRHSRTGFNYDGDPMPGAKPFRVTTNEDSLVLWMWFREDMPHRHFGCRVYTYQADDEHGCTFNGGWQGCKSASNAVGYAVLRQFPRTGRPFPVRIVGLDGNLVAQFMVTDPSPTPRQMFHPDPLPARQSSGDLAVRLSDVTAERRAFSAALEMAGACVATARLEPLRHGRPTNEWVLEAVTLATPDGNAVTTDLLHDGGKWHERGISFERDLDGDPRSSSPDLSPGDGVCSFGGLCPFEPAWRLRARFAPTADLPAGPGESCLLLDAPPPAPGTILSINREVAVHGATVRLVATAGPGTYSTRGGTIHPCEEYADPATDFVAEHPFVVVRASGLAADQRLALHATDERGRPIHVGTIYDVEDVYLLQAPPGAGRLHLTAIVRRTREVEFTFKPPVPQTGAR